MISANEYATAKAADRATLAKVGSSFAIEWKRYNATTGAEIDPEITAVGLSDVESAISDATTLLANLSTLKSDMEALG